MTETTYSCGNDNFSKDNRRYAYIDTDKGRLIATALETSGVPHTGTFTDHIMRFAYDADYMETVDEIIRKAKSGEYDEMLREIKENKDESGYLILLPTVAYYLHMTEGTLRQRPDDVQIQLCQIFTQLWCCDTPTIQRELTRVLNANRETEQDMESAQEQTIQQNNTPEKRESSLLDDIQHRQNVLRGDEDHDAKAEQTAKEEVRTGLISRELIRRKAEIIKRQQAVKEKVIAERGERERKF